MESTKIALTSGVPRSMTVEEVFSLSEGDGGTGMARDVAEDHSNGLGMVTLLK